MDGWMDGKDKEYHWAIIIFKIIEKTPHGDMSVRVPVNCLFVAVDADLLDVLISFKFFKFNVCFSSFPSFLPSILLAPLVHALYSSPAAAEEE